MANTFKLKTKANVGVATVGIYTATSPVTATVIIGVTLANVSGSSINVGVGITRPSADNISLMKDVPLPQGSSIEFMAGNKIVLEQSDTITAISDVNNSLDVALTIMEVTP
jgi:hypothetical protein|tara:strand:- start:622 stop:954 length:333 start_codon:yes stop_codon:yes gene_type:complete